MKKLLLILLCLPMIFSCGDKKEENKKSENQEERRSKILSNQKTRDVNNINDPCDCNDMLYSVYKDMIDLADGRMKLEIEKNEEDNTVLKNLYQEHDDIANVCVKMHQRLGEKDFYRNHSNCKYPNLRKLRTQLSELEIAFVDDSKTDVDLGIPRKLPPMEKQQENPPKFHERNIWQVFINNDDAIMVEGEGMEILQLRGAAKKFINNNGRNENLSDNPQKAIISLKSGVGTSYKMYIRVQNELTAAYTELRNEATLREFKNPYYANLSGSQKKKIKKMYPQKISEAEPVEIKKEE